MTGKGCRMQKYLSLTRAGIMEALQFRLGTVVMILGNLLYLTITYYLWRSIYASSGTDVVNGMSFSDTLIYLVLATALFNFMEMYAVWEIGRDIQSGKIVLDILKPMEFRSYLFWSYSGTLIMQFITTFLPTFVVVKLLTGNVIALGLNLLYFAVSVVMSVMINYSIDYIVGTICLFTESIWGINIMKQVIVMLLSGAAIPLAFFPGPLKTIVGWLPFQAVYHAPLTLLLDGDPAPEMVLGTLGTQLIWCVVMTVISKVFWKVSLRQITVNGG